VFFLPDRDARQVVISFFCSSCQSFVTVTLSFFPALTSPSFEGLLRVWSFEKFFFPAFRTTPVDEFSPKDAPPPPISSVLHLHRNACLFPIVYVFNTFFFFTFHFPLLLTFPSAHQGINFSLFAVPVPVTDVLSTVRASPPPHKRCESPVPICPQ